MSPQPKVAEWIANSINYGSLKTFNCQLLIRLHPQANPDHYKHLIEKENVVVHVPGQKSEFQDRLFSLEDDLDFASTMFHADVMINMASTVTIDAAVFDTPIICECIDLFGKRDIKNSIYRFYAFDHFSKLSENNGFELVRTLESLDDQIKFCLDNPLHKKEGRSRIVDQQCVYRDGKSGYRTASYILEVLDSVTKENAQR
jgi:CDP-glycerol glycerophosphotransferase (TagB/SpsB family)